MLNKYQWPLMLFVMVITLMWQSLNLSADEMPCALIGKPVPKFALESVGQTPTIPVTEEIFKGQTSILVVWSSHCRGCVKLHEVINELEKSKDYQLIGLDYKDSKKKADQWLNKLGNPYKVNIFDPKGRFGMDIGVYGTPSTYIIDSAGIIRYRHVGTLTHDSWNKKIVPEINKLKA